MKLALVLCVEALLVPTYAFHSLSRDLLSRVSPESSPHLVGRGTAETRAAQDQQHEARHPDLIGDGLGSLGALVSTVAGLVGSVAAVVDPNNKRPEPGYEFQAPGPNDSRGPCPGLNLLANYGYLPRDGHVTLGQVLNATARGFNMGADLATVLGVFAVLTDGDIASESFYLGAPPSGVGGLNRHSTVEVDISPNREDFYNGCGDNHHLSSRRFKQHVGFLAASSSKQFDLDVMKQQWAANADFSRQNNPYLYFGGFPAIVALGAYPFYPNFMSNGTYGLGGVANYDSISSIIGAKFDATTGDFTYVPERWANNWYRRAIPYGVTQTLLDLELTYLANPIPQLTPQLGTSNFNVNTLLCDIYQTINSLTPAVLGGSVQDTAAAITWALNKLAPFISPSVLGCPAGTLSPNTSLFPNASNPGGPANPPSSVVQNTGNNVYNKVYFKTAPSNPPQCS